MDCSFLFPNAGGELVTISFEEACQGSHSIFTHGRGHGRYCGGLGGRGFAGGHWGEGSHSPNVEGCHKNATLASTIENGVRSVEAGNPVMDKNPEHVIPPFQPAVQPQERRQLG